MALPGEAFPARRRASSPQPGRTWRQIVRDVHRSGTPLPKDYIEKVEAYNRETEELKKKGETQRYSMPLEVREVDAGGKRAKKTLFTCESCHTFHLETPFPSYVRASYRKGGDLCTGCHP